MIQVGLIGTGSATRVTDLHARGFQRDGRARIRAVLNRTEAGSQRWVQRMSLDVRVCTSLEELLELCDAVVVCTPNHTHADYAKAVLAADKHLLLEKPMTCSANEAAGLEEAVRHSKGFCGVGYVYRFAQPVQLLRQVVRERFGQIYTVGASMGGTRLANPQVEMEWRMKEALSGSGALHDFGSHLVDTIHFLTGNRYPQVFCSRQTVIPRRPSASGMEVVETDDSACLCLRGAGLSELLVSRVGLGPMDLYIAGEGGMARLNLGPSPSLRIWEKPADGGYTGAEQIIPIPQGENVEEWFCRQAADFLNGIEGRPTLGASFSDGQYVDSLLSAALRSADSGRLEPV